MEKVAYLTDPGPDTTLWNTQMAFSLDSLIMHYVTAWQRAICKIDHHSFELYASEEMAESGDKAYAVCSERISVMIDIGGQQKLRNPDYLLTKKRDPKCVLLIIEDSDHPRSMLGLSINALSRCTARVRPETVLAGIWVEHIVGIVSDRWAKVVDLAISHNRVLVSFVGPDFQTMT